MFGTSTIPRLWGNGTSRPPQDQSPEQPSRKSNFKSALEHIAVPDVFFRGIDVFKVTAKGKLEPATLTISRDKFIISVLPRTVRLERVGSSNGGRSGLMRPGILSRARSGNNSVGSSGGVSIGTIGTMSSVDGMETSFLFSPSATVDIGSIDRIESGQNTLLFEKARQRERKQTMNQRARDGVPPLDERRSFSLVFRGARTLDLMVDESGDREEIIYVLNDLVTEYGKAKVKVGKEVLLLRYVWNDVDRVRPRLLLCLRSMFCSFACIISITVLCRSG